MSQDPFAFPRDGLIGCVREARWDENENVWPMLRSFARNSSHKLDVIQEDAELAIAFLQILRERKKSLKNQIDEVARKLAKREVWSQLLGETLLLECGPAALRDGRTSNKQQWNDKVSVSCWSWSLPVFLVLGLCVLTVMPQATRTSLELDSPTDFESFSRDTVDRFLEQFSLLDTSAKVMGTASLRLKFLMKLEKQILWNSLETVAKLMRALESWKVAKEMRRDDPPSQDYNAGGFASMLDPGDPFRNSSRAEFADPLSVVAKDDLLCGRPAGTRKEAHGGLHNSHGDSVVESKAFVTTARCHHDLSTPSLPLDWCAGGACIPRVAVSSAQEDDTIPPRVALEEPRPSSAGVGHGVNWATHAHTYCRKDGETIPINEGVGLSYGFDMSLPDCRARCLQIDECNAFTYGRWQKWGWYYGRMRCQLYNKCEKRQRKHVSAWEKMLGR